MTLIVTMRERLTWSMLNLKPRIIPDLLTKRECDRVCNNIRINIGLAFRIWRELRDLKCCKSNFIFILYYSMGE